MSSVPVTRDPFEPRVEQDLLDSDGLLPGACPTTGNTTIPSNTTGAGNRPLNVEPTPQGGVAIGGRGDLPLGHASLADKIAGKTQKVMGKLSNNPELHEKGELRESGGKAAAVGEARAPHD